MQSHGSSACLDEIKAARPLLVKLIQHSMQYTLRKRGHLTLMTKPFLSHY